MFAAAKTDSCKLGNKSYLNIYICLQLQRNKHTHVYVYICSGHASALALIRFTGTKPPLSLFPLLHSPLPQVDSASDTLQGQIQRSMRLSSVVLCCITPKYLQSDNCIKDLSLAETFGKPIIPLLLRFTPFESAPSQVRRILLRHSYVDLSNERLYKQNIGVVLEKVKKAMNMSAR